MKTYKILITIFTFITLLFAGCSEQAPSPIDPEGQELNKGPVLNSVTGSGHITLDGKIVVLTINAVEYADGTYGGQYEVNLQAGYHIMEHGEVMFLKIYNNVPGFGTVAMVGGQVKSSNIPEQVNIYECYVIVDNGSNTDLEGYWIPYIETLEHAEEYWNSYPTDFIYGFVTSWGETWLGSDIVECEMGNFTIH